MSAGPGLFARIGLAVARPRWALALAGDRAHPGRSGSDFVAMIGILLLATQLRGMVGSIWLGAVVDASLGVRAFTHILTRTLTLDLGFLVVGALLLWAVAGPKRNLGRAFDLACVAALPLLLVDLGATVVVRTLEIGVPSIAGWLLAALSWAWTGALLALASRVARMPSSKPLEAPGEVVRTGTRAGFVVAAIAVIGVVVQVQWIVRYHDDLRPVDVGTPAPAIALPAIGPSGTFEATRTLAEHRGKIVVVDFWATWCTPCVKALPELEALHRRDDVEVLAINLDDPEAAHTLFEGARFTMLLLADDGAVSERYAVTSIPHTVVIDRDGNVRHVARGAGKRVDAAIEHAIAELASGASGSIRK